VVKEKENILLELDGGRAVLSGAAALERGDDVVEVNVGQVVVATAVKPDRLASIIRVCKIEEEGRS